MKNWRAFCRKPPLSDIYTYAYTYAYNSVRPSSGEHCRNFSGINGFFPRSCSAQLGEQCSEHCSPNSVRLLKSENPTTSASRTLNRARVVSCENIHCSSSYKAAREVPRILKRIFRGEIIRKCTQKKGASSGQLFFDTNVSTWQWRCCSNRSAAATMYKKTSWR